MKKLTSILIVVAMILSMVPATALAAEENTFSDYDELNALCAAEYSERADWTYAGTEELVISGDCTIPGNVTVWFGDDSVVTVAEGATLTVSEGAETYCGTMNVAGTLNNSGSVRAYDLLNVTGSVANAGRIDTYGDNGLSGTITMGEMGSLYKFYPVSDAAALLSVLNNAAASTDGHIYYEATVTSGADITLSQDAVISNNCVVTCESNSALTVTIDCTLTNNGFVINNGAWMVNGLLETNGDIHLWNNAGATMTFTDTVGLSGSGTITAFCIPGADGSVDFTQVISGLDFDAYYTSEYDDGDFRCLALSTQAQGVEGEGGQTREFASLEELQAILAEGEAAAGVLVHAGNDALEITEDLTIPAYFELQAGSVVVCEGAVFQVQSPFAHFTNLEVREGAVFEMQGEFVDFTTLTVAGEMSTNHAYVSQTLNVSGVWNVHGGLTMDYPATISGRENIIFDYEGEPVWVNAPVSSPEELTAILAELAETAGATDDFRYNVSLNPQEGNTFTILSDTTIPANICVNAYDCDVIVAAGATLTVDGELSTDGALTVNGAIVNNAIVSLNYDGSEQAKLSLGEAGKYSGNGTLMLHLGKTDDDPSLFLDDSLPLDDFDVTLHMDPEGHRHYELRYVAGLIKLGTPYELSWGTRYDAIWNFDEETQTETVTYEATDAPGWISWHTKTPDQAQALIQFYRVEEGGDVLAFEGMCGFGPDEQPDYRAIDLFLINDPDSGTYYFTVTSIADYITYRNSDTAVSGTYTYVKPEAQLDTCTDLKWDGRNVSWTGVSNGYLDGYQIEYWFSETGEEGTFEQFAGTSGRPGTDAPCADAIDYEMIASRGIGYYNFRVRALSRDIEVVNNGEWSEFAPVPYNVTELSTDVNSELDQILNNSTDPDTALQAVQQMDTEALKVAMNADQDSTGATAKIAELEDMVAGGPASISVTQDAAAFAAEDISIVGANLNTNTSEADEITLVVDKPQEDHVIPELYDSAVAVSFSMTLTNVEDVKNLEVPVKITLPVPDTINPEFLVILHYNVEGSHEIIRPYVYEEDGQVYADFVLTSFCDFIMTQELTGEEEHEHVFDQEIPEEQYLKSEADCSHAAEYYKSCACGEASGEESFEYGETAEHAPTWEFITIGHKCSCAECGKVLDVELGYHHGGHATCCEQAQCELCGEHYGALAAHADHDEDGMCDTCGCELNCDSGDRPGNILDFLWDLLKRWFRP